jgi:hypothetical protein
MSNRTPCGIVASITDPPFIVVCGLGLRGVGLVAHLGAFSFAHKVTENLGIFYCFTVFFLLYSSRFDFILASSAIAKPE